MVSDDLRAFYARVLNSINEDYVPLCDAIAHGEVPYADPATPYEYWVGLAKGHAFALSELKRIFKRFEGDLFEDDEDEGE